NSLRKLHDVDLVHVQWPIPNGLGALFLKRIYGIPYINTIHGEEVYLSKRYHTLTFLRSMVNNSFKSLTNSSATLKTCLDVGLNEEKFEVIPFGVDTDFFRPLKIDKDKNTFQILAVGYLIERKGFEYLIKAMNDVLERYDNVYLRIVGSGPLEKQLKRLIKDLNLNGNVEILKNVSDDELLNLYNLSDLFILPSVVDSQGNTEGLGVVLLEAMACGLSVIGSDVGGIPDIIQDGETGLLVHEKNVNDLSRSIISLIENENLRDRITFNGYNMVRKEFSWGKIAEKYLMVYNSF
ncbi:MAG: glycosyltransferase family 4 protein, partial [Methanobacterium paludis]|nr:glycosyltransferase family 4 protein [Methanobacterium paludis]